MQNGKALLANSELRTKFLFEFLFWCRLQLLKLFTSSGDFFVFKLAVSLVPIFAYRVSFNGAIIRAAFQFARNWNAKRCNAKHCVHIRLPRVSPSNLDAASKAQMRST